MEMPEAEEGNRTEIGPKLVKLCRGGQMLQVQTNGAVRANDGKGSMLRVRTRVAYADECCMFGKLLQVMWTAKRQ